MAEQEADTHARRVAAKRLPLIYDRTHVDKELPAVMEAVESAFTMIQWNNWWDDPTVVTPPAFRQQAWYDARDSSRQFHALDSGVSRKDMEAIADGFLNDLQAEREGKWGILVQAGTTHGTIGARVANILHDVLPTNSPNSHVEDWVGFNAYHFELEAAICDRVRTTEIIPTPAPNVGSRQ